MLGHDVTIFEAKAKPGGLNEYGLAAYKMANDFAQREVEFLLGIGGIKIEYGNALGSGLALDELRKAFAAVFIGIGIAKTNRLGIPGETLPGVRDALEFIGELRQAADKSTIAVGKNVVVIGGGNTAIDAAVQAKRLGAANVVMAYRRGEQSMTATEWERDLARTNGVMLRTGLAPTAIEGATAVSGAVRRDLRHCRRHGPQSHRPEAGRRGVRRTEAAARQDRGRCEFHDLGSRRLCRRRLHQVGRRPDRPGGGRRQARRHRGRQIRARRVMADLHCTIGGVKSVNPFWLASAPPTDKYINVKRAFDAGWGGVVWKTLGVDPPVVNASSRYGVHRDQARGIVGINNIELISDRPLDDNLREIEQLRREYPDRVIIGSLMATVDEQSWKSLAIKIANAGVQGIELNLGCPHGMCERGMGSAIGQVPEMVENTTRWVRDAVGSLPVFTKLTPNITDIVVPAEAAKRGGADGVALINTVNSIVSVDLERHVAAPDRGRQGHAWRLLRHGGQTHRAQHGAGHRPRSGDGGPRHLGHRRHHDLARRGGVHRAGRAGRAGLHRGDAVRLSHRRRHDRRPGQLHGREPVPLHRGFPRQGAAQHGRLERPQSQFRPQGLHPPGPVHRVRPLPHRLRGRGASGDPHRREARTATAPSP